MGIAAKNGGTAAFTVRDFLVLVLEHEFSIPDKQILSPDSVAKLEKAGIYWFNDNCWDGSGSSCMGATDNAILNWMGEAMDSARYIFNTDPMGTVSRESEQVANIVADAIYSVHSVTGWAGNTLGGGEDVPIHWATGSYYRSHYGMLPDAVFLTFNNYAIDISGNTNEYLVSENEEDRMCATTGWNPCGP